MPTTDPELTTERLRLRRLQPGDAPLIAPLVNDWEVARWTSHIPHPYTVQMADEFIAAQAEATSNGSQVFAILRKDDDTLVGCVGLHRGIIAAAQASHRAAAVTARRFRPTNLRAR